MSGISEAASARRVSVTRTTSETAIEVSIDLDGTGRSTIASGIGFLDHMLTTLSKHSRIDIDLSCKGDLHIDDHHSAEDCAIALGDAVHRALGDRKGIVRFGHAYAPLDEALARAVVDLSGRPWPQVDLGLTREALGGLACENITHFFNTFAMTVRAAIHIDVLKGQNDHHRAEAAFKSLAIALRSAVARDGVGGIASTKGTLS